VKERLKVQEQLASIPTEEERLLLATGRYIGEGFDDARLDILFLTLPVLWRGTLVQYVGRLHRLHPGKHEAQIVDDVDGKVPMLARMFERRLRGYRAIGYQENDVGG
jgi:superfamily II DNA or RNA helicase